MADAVTKTSKEKAEYRPWPKGRSWCSRCSMFREPDSCTAVEGKILPSGYCNLFKLKNGKKR